MTKNDVFRRLLGVLSLLAITTPAWSEQVYLLEERATKEAHYSFRRLGSVDGARRVALAGTGGHVLVLTERGRVWAWGDNSQAQLGAGDTGAHDGFVEAQALREVTGIAAGSLHSVALTRDGTVWTWGANDQGQLGDGSLLSRPQPRAVMSDVSMIAAGGAFTLALRSDGAVWAFGSNWSQIMPGEARRMITEPVQVQGLAGIEALAIRGDRGYAKDRQGRIWIWGTSGGQDENPLPHLLQGGQLERSAKDLERRFKRSMRLAVTDVEWTGNSRRERLVRLAQSALQVVEPEAVNRYAFKGTVLDVESGWAVGLVTADSGGTALSSAATSPKSDLRKSSLASKRQALLARIGQPLASSVPKLSASETYGLVVKPNGTVCGCGRNEWGQLGDGTSTNRRVPATAAQMTGITGVSAGWYHSLAVTGNGTVWSWGHNGYGELGNGTSYHQPTPFPVAGLTGMTAVATGAYHSLALKNDGTVWAWGGNGSGQLGDGTFSGRTRPVKVVTLANVKAIAAGDLFSLALKNDGTVWAWGDNSSGRLGDGTVTQRSSAVQVVGLTGIVGIAAGYYHGMAVKSDGTVWTWGYNNFGQLGDGSFATRLTAVRVAGLTGVTAVAGGQYHSLAAKSDGTAWAWGANWKGQLGDGTTLNRVLPARVNGLTGVVAVAGGSAYSSAMKADSSQWAWGENTYGQIGNGSTSDSVIPVLTSACSPLPQVPGPPPSPLAGRIQARETHSLALAPDDTLRGWGRNLYGQLGDGTATNRCSPAQAAGLAGVSGVSTGWFHSLAVKSDGTVRSWGNNGWGQLGDGTDNPRASPGPVSGLSGVKAVATGAYHSLALKNDETVWAWGANGSGQLGDGTNNGRTTPVKVVALTNVKAIAAGDLFSLALKDDGTVWAWGDNGAGRLGDGTEIPRTTATQVLGLTGVVAIAAGYYNGMALKNDGTVWTWGYNNYGQLGDGSFNYRPTIGRVSDVVSAVAIAAGQAHGLATLSDGTVWAWGANWSGQLGDASTTIRTTPVKAHGLTATVAVAAGANHSLAFRSDGYVWSWGSNQFGQFGVCNPADSTVPIEGPFIGLPTTGHDVSVHITKDGIGLSGVTVNLTGSLTRSGSTDTLGNYTFSGLTDGGNYTVTPSLCGYTFMPPSQTFNSLSANQTATFTATLASPKPVVLLMPANNALNVAPPVTLKWQASCGAAFYDVYLGTTATPPLIASGNTGTAYQLTGAAGLTTYFWKVVAKNSSGEASSPVWKFKTKAIPVPAKPTNPGPKNAAPNVSRTPTLKWKASANATSYDVYLSTKVNPTDIACTNLTTASCSVTGPLLAKKKYFWKVVAKNSAGSSSASWSFTTQ